MKYISIVFNRFVDNLFRTKDKKISFQKIGLIILSAFLYSLLINWKFALLIMIAVGWHESGHVWALRRLKIPTHGFYFLPLLGGVTISTEPYRSLKDKVIVSIMGPIWGMCLALITWFAFLLTHNPFLGAAAFWQAFFNLFNLLPVNPLDGGQIVQSVCFSCGKRIGNLFLFLSVLAFAGMFIFWVKSPLFLIAAIAAFKDFWTSIKYGAIDSVGTPLTKPQIITALVSYVGLIVILMVIMVLNLSGASDLVLFTNS